MAKRKKRNKALKQAILTAAAVVAGSTTATGCCPMVCDPAPPPSRAPAPTGSPTMTPMIFDPPPPPSVVRPTSKATMTPMICDTPPRPSATPRPIATPSRTPMLCDPVPAPSLTPRSQASATPQATRQFGVRSVDVSTQPGLVGAEIAGRVLDARGQPAAGLWVAVEGANYRMQVRTDEAGSYILPLPGPGTYLLIVGGDQAHGLSLPLKAHERAAVEWAEVAQTTLPLAEMREVAIAWRGGLTFVAETPWPGATCRWSASGGALAVEGQGVAWQPPAEPGRYLLQVVADWGAAGLAVDATALTVEQSGRVIVG